MKITFLGTGTSSGIPLIGCNCDVCTSSDWRDKRLRCSVLLEWHEHIVIIDAGTDFRQQVLRENVQKLDAVLLTHAHIDHIGGLDELRAFNFKQGKDIPVYADDLCSKMVQEMFAYVFAENKYPGAPNILLNKFNNSPFNLGGKTIIPIQVLHGNMPISGFRIDDFAYVTDAKYIKEEEKEKLKKLKILVINAVRREAHHSHFNLEEALALTDELKAEKTYFIHISHRFDTHANIQNELPNNVFVAYDGLKVSI